MLLKQLPNDVNISANDYVHVEDENNWTILTDEDETVEKLRGCRRSRRVELVIQKYLKQVSLHHFEDKMIEQ